MAYLWDDVRFSAHLWNRPICGNRPSCGTQPSCESYPYEKETGFSHHLTQISRHIKMAVIGLQLESVGFTLEKGFNHADQIAKNVDADHMNRLLL